MATFADKVIEREVEEEHARLVKSGYSDAEARAMVYEEEVPIDLVGITLVDLAEYDAARSLDG